jgi:hypothetical protein
MSHSTGSARACQSAAADAANGTHFARVLSYHGAGLCTVPIKRDGSKSPAAGTWPDRDKDGRPRLPTEAELCARFDRPDPPGVAILGGAVSRNQAVIDIEYPDFFQALAELVDALAPGLLEELPRVATPGKGQGPGTHLHFRSRAPLPSQKLAKLTPEEAERRTGDPKKATAIEIKAEGGYFLVPGSPACCHESGRRYEHVAGPFIEETPLLSDEQVNVLLRAARSLTQVVAPEDVRDGPKPAKGDGRPGDDFNRRGWEWGKILAGWEQVCRDAQGRVRWRRPGKDKGWSATTGCRATQGGHELFYCFTSNGEPFEENRAYSKFSAYALLHHGGDWSAAAAELARQGFGEAAAAPACTYEGSGFLLTIAPERKRWSIQVKRGGELVGQGVANLNDAKSRRDLVRACKLPDEAASAALAELLLKLSGAVQDLWSAYQRRQAEQGQRQAQEAAERAAEEAADERRARLAQVEAVALPFLADPMLLFWIGADLQQRGLVNERANSLVLFLCLVSQVLKDPISAVAKGDSSGGKSHVVKTVLGVVPDGAHIDLTSMSEKGIIYDERQYAHRTVVVYEVHGEGGEFTNYLIRTLISEGEIRHLTVESTPLGPVGREIVKEGPTNFLTTTTFPETHAENETRTWTLLVDDSPGQTKKVLAMQAAIASGAYTPAPPGNIHDSFVWLHAAGVKEAVVPFAPQLAELMPDRPLRLRRDFPRLLTLIRAIAVLHQRQRQRDEQGNVLAELADYAMARELVAPIFLRAVLGVTEKTLELVEAVEAVLDRKGESMDRDKARASYSDLVEETGKPKHYISRWLKPALQIGMVDNENAGEKGRPASLKEGKFKREDCGDALPTVEVLARKLGSAAHWCSPLTGESCGVAG